jgi:hypothetical protein
MSAVVVVVQRADHKLYPPAGVLPDAEFRRAVNLCHTWRCRDGMSYRKIVAALEAEGIRASIGSVHAWIRRYSCRFEPGDA